MESWKRKLRMGMVGGGPGAFIGAVHRLCAAMDGQIELVAGCFSQDPAKTKKTGAELYLDPKRCYATYKEMAAAEAKLPADQRIDFVSVVTPNKSHYEISETFLKAGFHVVCDKPVTFTLDEAQKLAKVVEKTKLVFAVTHNYTGHPLIRHARQIFKTGELGKVHKVIVEYLQDFLMTPHENLGHKQASWRVDPKQSGIGGTLGDIGTHCVNLLEYVTGDPIVALCADKSSFLPGRKLDEDVNALLRFKNGGKGVLIISQVSAGEENGLRLRVYAEKGAILWKQENPNYMELYRYGQPRETLTRGQDYLSGEAKSATRIPSGHPEGYLEAFANIYVGAARAIRRHIDGKPMKTSEYEFPTIYDGVRGMEFIYAAVESYKKGSSWVKL
ncbi:MAG TPA: Gfo/Idh/MocA family oxidoreductase [Terriglobales bacterium]|jgi:predicted dehydrogenase|nr:Gfo/Idh/MocA family oxidoreductase [Terriglobales bacterium]